MYVSVRHNTMLWTTQGDVITYWEPQSEALCHGSFANHTHNPKVSIKCRHAHTHTYTNIYIYIYIHVTAIHRVSYPSGPCQNTMSILNYVRVTMISTIGLLDCRIFSMPHLSVSCNPAKVRRCSQSLDSSDVLALNWVIVENPDLLIMLLAYLYFRSLYTKC